MHVLKGVLACISIAITTVSVSAVLLVWSLHLAIAPKASKPAIKKTNGLHHHLVDKVQSLDDQPPASCFARNSLGGSGSLITETVVSGGLQSPDLG